jgi:hypothetical protein
MSLFLFSLFGFCDLTNLSLSGGVESKISPNVSETGDLVLETSEAVQVEISSENGRSPASFNAPKWYLPGEKAQKIEPGKGPVVITIRSL